MFAIIKEIYMHKTKNEKASFIHGGGILFMKSTYIIDLSRI